MKKLLILLLFSFLVSCSTEQENNSSSFIPERFVGNWISASKSFSAEIKTEKITIEISNGIDKELITRTKGTTIEYNNTTLFRTDLGNKEELILLFRERDENTKDDDIIGITLYRDGETITNTYYLRK